MTPTVVDYDGIRVVRDDLFPGGTKARFLGMLFDGAPEVVYASPAEGGAQTALATVGQQRNIPVTIFVADRKIPHARALMAKALGARVCLVRPGYLGVVQARAKSYCAQSGARLIPFGADVPEAIAAIAAAARSTGERPDEVWCAAGSGVLARGLARAWPEADRHVVRVGRPISAKDVAGATIHDAGIPFEREAKMAPPFPSDQHYDAKAWAIMMAARPRRTGRTILFWNVTGPATRPVP